MRRRPQADVLICAALPVVCFLLYRDAVHLWWTYDDPFDLRQAFTHSVASILASADFWHPLPNRVFHPLMFLSVKLDLALFGLDPYGHYLHHLLAVALVPVAVYGLCRLWLSRWRSVAAALLVIMGPPFCEVTAQLYHRHYVEGLILSIVAAVLAVVAFRRQRWAWSAGSAALYFLAMTAKEVFVPLPLLLLAVPVSTIRGRVMQLVPHAVAVMFYALWRTAMLGFSVSGYGLTTARDGWPQLLVTLPARVLRHIGGSDGFLGTLVVTIVAAMILSILVLESRSRVLVVLGALAALGPILPVASRMETRFVLTTWVLVAIACAFVPSRSRWIPIPVLILGAVVLLSNRAEWDAIYRITSRMSDEGRFYVSMAPGAILRNPAIPPAALMEMEWIAARAGRPAAGKGSYDDLPYCLSDARGELYEYTERLRRVVRVSDRFVERTVCRRIRDDLPLNGRFSYRDGVLYWTLGPHREGRYRFVLAGGAQAFDVPAEAGFRLPDVPGMTLRIRYESPAGWITYSPEVALDFGGRPDRTWHR